MNFIRELVTKSNATVCFCCSAIIRCSANSGNVYCRRYFDFRKQSKAHNTNRQNPRFIKRLRTSSRRAVSSTILLYGYTVRNGRHVTCCDINGSFFFRNRHETTTSRRRLQTRFPIDQNDFENREINPSNDNKTSGNRSTRTRARPIARGVPTDRSAKRSRITWRRAATEKP